ncbi:CsbD family protein [Candidatus Frankia alpina]|uniref:CsbD family protein n=1 Tax=Candidatus Frankia alpina TaxID=2699483 RepID=UPI001F3DD1A0|nr:CsbD family protein [Candidatus Frankia alpina]
MTTPRGELSAVSFVDKVKVKVKNKNKNKVGELRGRGKETAGKATDNRDLRADGASERGIADLRNAGEKTKDAFRH